MFVYYSDFTNLSALSVTNRIENGEAGVTMNIFGL